ncbi:Universal stress protein A-like protein [Bienertia sinuspersici]
MQIDAEAISTVGNPKDAICDAVQKYNCTLLVMGSRSRGAIKRFCLITCYPYSV